MVRRHDSTPAVAGEANLAARIEAERNRHGWSYGELAKRVTAVGSPMSKAALYRIERGNAPGKPARTISVDEMIAFTKVFEVSIADLLTPVELVDQERARHLVAELERVTNLLLETTVSMFNMYLDLYVLAADRPELHEYVDHHWRAMGEGTELGGIVRPDGEAVTEMAELAVSFGSAIATLAQQNLLKAMDQEGLNHGER